MSVYIWAGARAWSFSWKNNSKTFAIASSRTASRFFSFFWRFRVETVRESIGTYGIAMKTPSGYTSYFTVRKLPTDFVPDKLIVTPNNAFLTSFSNLRSVRFFFSYTWNSFKFVQTFGRERAAENHVTRSSTGHGRGAAVGETRSPLDHEDTRKTCALNVLTGPALSGTFEMARVVRITVRTLAKLRARNHWQHASECLTET